MTPLRVGDALMHNDLWLLLQGVAQDRWSYLLQYGTHVVGRSPECEIQVSHRTVSRRHAEICCDETGISVRDLDSLNGVFLDEVPVSESQLTCGTVLRIGQVRFELVSSRSFEDESSIIDLDRDADVEGSCGPVTLIAKRRIRQLSTMLTPAQLQVLKLLLQGLSEKMVASALSNSRQTIHSHVKEIYRLLDVHSRPELMALFISPTLEWQLSAQGSQNPADRIR